MIFKKLFPAIALSALPIGSLAIHSVVQHSQLVYFKDIDGNILELYNHVR